MIIIRRRRPTCTISCPENIVCGEHITKEKRKEMFGIISGGAGSQNPENYQRDAIIRGTNNNCIKTNIRINYRTNELVSIVHPNKNDNGFDFSENFDGKQVIDSKTIYINLKCICGTGGAQTRSLREVYWFIEGQLKVLKNKNENIYFANIIDGDESIKCLPKFQYICSLEEYTEVKKNVYVGDLRGYFTWLKTLFE